VLLAGLVREQVVARAREQVARGVDVEIEFITQPCDDVIRIDAPVRVETETRKGILIGAGGGMIKSNGVAAHHPIERELASRVHHDLSVRVRRRWRADERVLDRLAIEQAVLELPATGRPR
jgi:GTPase